MKRTIRFGIAGIAMGLALACGGDMTSPPQTAPINIPGLSARLDVQSSAHVGESVLLRLVLTNETSQSIVLPLMFYGDDAFDPVVRAADGTPIWQRSLGQYISAVGETRVVQPNQETTYEATWDLRDQTGTPIQAGTYRVTGRLVAGDSVVVSTAEASIIVSP